MSDAMMQETTGLEPATGAKPTVKAADGPKRKLERYQLMMFLLLFLLTCVCLCPAESALKSFLSGGVGGTITLNSFSHFNSLPVVNSTLAFLCSVCVFFCQVRVLYWLDIPLI